MKYSKQILEAVNRGIKLALDDFDEIQDQEPILSKKKVQNYDIKNDFDLYNLTVDLGLPSRTLWCKHNLGVKLDNTYSPIDEVGIGDYYAWGETEPNKPKYDMESYKFGNGSGQMDEITKYVTSENFICNPFNDDSEILTLVDNLTQLLPEDDAAYQNKKLYNFKFHIPTKDLFRELLYYTNAIWKNIRKDFSIYRCIELTSKINGNKIVFPACGYYSDNKCKNIGFVGQYWSSNINTHINNMAVALNFEDTHIKTIIEMKELYRCIGLQIRPVINL